MSLPTHEFWQAAMAGKAMPIHDGDVHLGYYKTKRGQAKGEPMVPASIWLDGDAVKFQIGTKMLPAEQHEEAFMWCAKNPISYDEAIYWHNNGGSWSVPALASIGHNSRNLSQEEKLENDIQDLKERFADASDKDALADCKTIATKLATRIEDMRKAEKEPHLQAGRDVDAKFKAISEPVLSIKDNSAKKLTAILKEEQRIENERLAFEREEARKLAALNVPIEEPKPIEAKIQAGGTFGNKISLRKVERVVFDDRIAALQALKDSDAFMSEIEQIMKRYALASIKAGKEVSGARIIIEELV